MFHGSGKDSAEECILWMLSTVFYKCQLGQVCQSLCSTLHVNAFFVCLFCQLLRKVCYIFTLSSQVCWILLLFFSNFNGCLLDTDEFRLLYPSVEIRFYHLEIHLWPLVLYLFYSILCLISSLWLYSYLLLDSFVIQIFFYPFIVSLSISLYRRL